MDYIILDLEWDSAYSVKHQRFINQILQIGAVRLNESFEITDTFEETVKSAISRKVTGRFSKLTGITTEKMLSGISIDEAVDRYNDWAIGDTVTMTWSDSDLYSIISNEKCLLSGGRRFSIKKYLDLQKFVQGEMRRGGYEDKNQISLSLAAELMNIPTDGFNLHTAKDDSLLCAALLKKCYHKDRFEAMVRDVQNPEFIKRLLYKPHYINNINSEEINIKDLNFSCDKCGGKATRNSAWRYRNRWFTAKFTCNECRRKFIGRLCFKKTYDEITVRRKITDIKPKNTENKTDEMQSVPETV